MKKCVECNAEVDDRAHVCPKCGGFTLIGSYSAEDALSLLDSMKDQSRAAEHVDKSAHLFSQGRLEEAIAELNIALKLNPMNPTAHGNMGHFLLTQGKPKEAIPWLEKALELNPNLEGVPQVLAEAKAKAANTESSACFVATACYGDPDCREVRVLRAYRDERLVRSTWGRLLVRIYYAYSPALSFWLEKRPVLRSIVRKRILNPIVTWLQKAKGQ